MICAIGLMAVGCQPKAKDIQFARLTDSGFYNCIAATETDTVDFSVEKRYDVQWPENAPIVLQKILAQQAFEGADVDWEDACMEYVEDVFLLEGETLQRSVRVDKVTDCKHIDTRRCGRLLVDYRQDGDLYCFEIKKSFKPHAEAKGEMKALYVTYDNEHNKIVRLNDLVDSALLGPVIVRALKELEVNKATDAVLKEAHREAVPVTGNFYIDDSRCTLHLVYQPGEIAPAADGIQTITMPLSWLSKQVKLKHYGKKTFRSTAE